MLKKIIKITTVIFSLLFVGLYTAFYFFSSPKSDIEVLQLFENSTLKPILTHENYASFQYRKLTIRKDTTLPTIIFVHGTIGSSTDFKKYMMDSLLLTKVNMVSYDRIGYNYKDKNNVQESIAFETSLLENLTKNMDLKKVILVGYSYGGPIALASKKKYKKVILLAPAVYSKVEPMPWPINLYKWKATRWLIPSVWKEASKEKMSHIKNLTKFENNWYSTPNKVISIHGTADWIVPYTNSEFLQKQFPEDKFELISINEANHDLIWSRFDIIKQQLLQQSN